MAVNTARLTSQAIDAYLRKLSEPVMVNARLLGILKAKGRISFNHDEHEIMWRVRYVRNEPTPNPGFPTDVTFNAPVRITSAKLPWRSYAMGEYIHKIEKLQGRSDRTQFPRLVENVVKWAMDDFQWYMQRVLYNDGDADPMSLHGLESMFAVGGAISGQPVYTPNDTYAGLSTVLGAFGGDVISGSFPTGQMDPQYRAWSPIVVNYTNTAFKTGNEESNWQNNWKKATRFARTWLLAGQGIDPDIMVMHPDLERQARDSTDPYAQLQVTAKSPIVDLGIKTLLFEGLELVSDAFCPADTAYLLPSDKMELLSMQGQLVAFNKTTDVYQADMLLFDFYGNMKFDSPAYFAKLRK